MKVSAKIDMPKLLRSLKKAGKNFGETNEQAIARWGVQTCRELAKGTQVFGTAAKKTKDRQMAAMYSDAFNIIMPTLEKPRSGSRYLRSEKEVSDWIEENRKGSKRRTRRIDIGQRKIVNQKLFKRAMKERSALIGKAKGGWLGAADSIGRFQRGTNRIVIGKAFLRFARPHSKGGGARMIRNLFSPQGLLDNRFPHTASTYVLSHKERKSATLWGLRKTISWYRRAAKKSLDKA